MYGMVPLFCGKIMHADSIACLVWLLLARSMQASQQASKQATALDEAALHKWQNSVANMTQSRTEDDLCQICHMMLGDPE